MGDGRSTPCDQDIHVSRPRAITVTYSRNTPALSVEDYSIVVAADRGSGSHMRLGDSLL